MHYNFAFSELNRQESWRSGTGEMLQFLLICKTAWEYRYLFWSASIPIYRNKKAGFNVLSLFFISF
jgi:hypothetical protein